MAFCERLSEQLAVIATIDPQAGATGAVTSDVFSMAMHRRAMFILQRGAGTAGCSIAIQEGTAGWTAGTATILSATALAVANTQHIFEVSAEAMADGLTELRAVLTNVGTDLVSMVALADVERYHPASDRDLPTVTIEGCAN